MLFKCFPTPENADGAADRTAPPELVIRNMFGSKQPAGAVCGEKKCCMLGRYATPRLAPPTTAANAELRSRGARQATVSQEVDIWALDVVRFGGTAGLLVFCDLS